MASREHFFISSKIIIEILSFMKFHILYIKGYSNTFLSLKLIARKICPPDTQKMFAFISEINSP